LHSDFYPKPAAQETAAGYHHFTPLTGGFLTKGEFFQFYGQCVVAP
jgi:hypothetical protein